MNEADGATSAPHAQSNGRVFGPAIWSSTSLRMKWTLRISTDTDQ
jgi:hypothetical protein